MVFGLETDPPLEARLMLRRVAFILAYVEDAAGERRKRKRTIDYIARPRADKKLQDEDNALF